ncbi:MAG: hypothetical protein LBR26_12055 [Prevotella sp.]|jgi:hypothetical protein|nr:hypothetical protein [Prevotella sp.]
MIQIRCSFAEVVLSRKSGGNEVKDSVSPFFYYTCITYGMVLCMQGIMVKTHEQMNFMRCIIMYSCTKVCRVKYKSVAGIKVSSLQTYARPAYLRQFETSVQLVKHTRRDPQLKEEKPSPEFHQISHLMEVWPINSAARQQEQKTYFPLVLYSSLYSCSGIIALSANTFNRLLFSRCRVP